MIRVGLTQRVSVVEKYGERRDCLDQAWASLTQHLGCTPIPLFNRIDDVGRYLESIGVDALILTGGNDPHWLEGAVNPAPERDAFETSALEHCMDNEIPVVGVCRGMQMINAYFGGSMEKVKDHVAFHHRVTFSEGEFLPVTVNSYHNYGISRKNTGDGLRVLGTADDGTVELFSHEDLSVHGIMWHPERESPSRDTDILLLRTILTGDRI